MKTEILLKKIDIEHDRFKIGISLLTILSSGLIGLLLKGIDTTLEFILYSGGLIIDGFLILYTLRKYSNVGRLFKLLEESK